LSENEARMLSALLGSMTDGDAKEIMGDRANEPAIAQAFREDALYEVYDALNETIEENN